MTQSHAFPETLYQGMFPCMAEPHWRHREGLDIFDPICRNPSGEFPGMSSLPPDI